MLKGNILTCFDMLHARTKCLAPLSRGLFLALVLGTAIGITACGKKDHQTGQVLARVNGEEITVLQVNDELKRAGVKPEQQEVATKQLLESLIDRQLILGEAMRNEVDRTTGVVQAIERAKKQIIAQAYLRSLDAQVTKPTAVEIDSYYQKHPEYFAQRKQYDVQQLAIATSDFSNELRSVVDSAKSLDVVASWMGGHRIHFVRGQMSRTTTDLPEQIVAKLKEMRKGQIFIVNEGENLMINVIANIKDSPVAASVAAPQIEQYLINKKAKEMAETELSHLRATAKIEYIAASAPTSTN